VLLVDRPTTWNDMYDSTAAREPKDGHRINQAVNVIRDNATVARLDTPCLLGITEFPLHSIAEDAICQNFTALIFLGELLSKSTRDNVKIGLCCLQGKVGMEQLPPTPTELGPVLLAEPDMMRALNNQFSMGYMLENVLNMPHEG
jgi:hypothetical protein